MSETAKHSGWLPLRAGALRGRDRLEPVLSCNCSICQKRGALLTFVPAAQFTLLSGEDDLTDYQFNKKIVHHLFCGHCGVGSFARGKGRTDRP